MDPDAAVASIVDHLVDGEIDEAEEALGDLREWLGRGGYRPDLARVVALINFTPTERGQAS